LPESRNVERGSTDTRRRLSPHTAKKPQSRAGWPGFPIVELVRRSLLDRQARMSKSRLSPRLLLIRLRNLAQQTQDSGQKFQLESRTPRTCFTSPSPDSPTRAGGLGLHNRPFRRVPLRRVLPWEKPHSHGPSGTREAASSVIVNLSLSLPTIFSLIMAVITSDFDLCLIRLIGTC
jgi:hypothetical protein